MFQPPTPLHAVLAIFASDKGSGDAERSSIMSQAGSYFARKGAQIVCLAEDDDVPVPLITSARAAGGALLIIADEHTTLPPSLSAIPVERIADRGERLARMGAISDVIVGLPGSLASGSAIYNCWAGTGTGGNRKPVVLLNRNRAFEVLRGLSVDILSHSVRNHDKAMQFADNVEDMWTRIARVVEAAH